MTKNRLKQFCDSYAFYKYVIEQPIATSKVKELKEKLLSKKDQFFSVTGRALHLSSIFFDKEGAYVQFHADIELDEREDLLEYISPKTWRDFTDFIYSINFYLVYTGGRGFHVYSRYPIFIKGLSIKNYNALEIKKKVFKSFNIEPSTLASKIHGESDNTMSITRMPTIRFGWRKEKENFAVPLIREFGLDSYSIVKFLCQHHNIDRKQRLLEKIFGNSKNFRYLLDRYLMPCE